MKHLITSFVAGALALGVTATATLAQEVTLRCQHFLSPKASVPAYFMEPWARKVEADSNGRIKVELYPAMALGGKPPAIYDQIRDGVIDCGWTLPAYTPGRFPETEAFELPFMTGMNAEAASMALWDYSQKHLTDRMGDIHLMAIHTHGPGVVHKKGPPVMQTADFEGLKLRGPSRQANALLERMGATTVGMPVPAFPEALSKGIVDGGVIPWEIVPPLKVHELADSHTQVGGDRAMYNSVFIWGMNKAKYASLPDDLKAVIDANSGLEASRLAGKAMDTGDLIGIDIVGATDNTVHTFDDSVVAEMKIIGAELTQAWIEDVTAKGLDGQAMVDDARALIAKYTDAM